MPHYSYKIRVLATFNAVLALLAFVPSARAEEAYTVENVTIDAAGTDAADARAKALAAGERDAFRQLAQRLSPATGAGISSAVTPAALATLVRSYDIQGEKITPDHYHAVMRYHFDAGATGALFGGAPLAASPAPSAPTAAPPPAPAPARARKAVLILPVYNDGKTLQLWQDENAWRNIWFDAALEAGGGMVVAPLGDLDDRVDVDDTNAESANAESLKRMYARYGVGAIDVVTAYYNQKADPKPTLEVTIKQITPEKTEILHRDYVIRSSETPPTLLVRAADDIAKYFYKRQTTEPLKFEYDRLKEVNARLGTQDIKEWQTLRKRLLAHRTVVGVKFNGISFYQTDFTIVFKGSPDMLGKTLAASGLRVQRDGNQLVLGLP